MLPIELTMQAVGSYPDKITIPFEKLSKGNIFLISGSTGSGKTTIFDAICFALFNKLSGSNRLNNPFRSHYAKQEVESYVEFKFLYKNEIYSIWRSPSYERPKLKGKGVILEKGKAILTLPNSKMIIGLKEVDSYIEELLGLDIDRFSQIALLAQGEFFKLLNSDTQKRTEIFRNIFKTAPYKAFELKLKDYSIKYKNDFQNYKNSILQYLSQIDTEDIELQNKIEIFNSKSQIVLDESFFNKITSQNEHDLNLKNDFDCKIKSNQASISNLNITLERIKTKESLLANLDIIENKIALLKKDFITIEKDFKNLKNFENKKEDLKNEIKKAKEDYSKALEASKINIELNNLKSQIQNFENDIKSNELGLYQTKLNHLKFLSFELNNFENELKNNQNTLIDLKNEYSKLNDDYILKYNLFIASQAGILAKTLKENTPCPVCGSIHHPNPAKLQNDTISAEKIDELKVNLDNKSNQLNNISKNCSVLIEKIAFYKDKITSLKKQYEIDEKFLAEKIQKIDFDDVINNQKNIINNLNDKKDNLEKSIIELNSKLLSFGNLNENYNIYIDNFNKKTDDFKILEEKIDKINNDYQNKNLEINSEISKKDLILNQLEPLKSIDLNLKDEIIQKINHLENENKSYSNDSQKVFSRLENNKKIFSILIEQYKKYLKIEDEYIKYKNLYDCASGQLKGKARIAFEEYIQGYFLDMVLFEANKRLKIISKGQYQLLRKTTTDNFQSKQGLDIEVMDFHTFKKRSTKTLSGGESFMAALCLAMGLSDCVMSYNGNIQIDSLFIDEGFGSLDSESLDTALDVIFNLGLNNRLVGIISHVDELKNRIDNKILTKKNQNGSTLEVLF